jgi:trans-2,3-dihydro-3-hydroxyanthranilate isomerase
MQPLGGPVGLEYALVDVFAETRLAGNQLAIFTDARGLSTEQMQALAREINLSETTFVFPEDEATEREQGLRVRIFTTREELPFAGHPTLGTASWAHLSYPPLRGAGEITLRLKAGPITVKFEQPRPGEQGVQGTMRQADAIFGAVHSREEVAQAIGMRVEDLDPHLAPQTVSTGLPFCIVPMRSLEAIGRLEIPRSAAAYLARHHTRFFYCTTAAEPGSGADFRSRMQFYSGEDPATGSASGCAIAYLVRHGAVPSGKPTVLAQGIEMGRPSKILVRATLRGDAVCEVFVGGRTIPVASGRFFQR